MAGVEREARKALRRIVFYRFVGEIFSFPQFILVALVALLTGLCKWLNRFEITIFALEQDAARRYQLLANFDLGLATGEPGRYAALNPNFAEAASEAFQRHALDEADDDDA